jgi:hypothetical protein
VSGAQGRGEVGDHEAVLTEVGMVRGGRIPVGGGGHEGRLGLQGVTTLRLMSSEGKGLPVCGSSLRSSRWRRLPLAELHADESMTTGGGG